MARRATPLWRAFGHDDHHQADGDCDQGPDGILVPHYLGAWADQRNVFT